VCVSEFMFVFVWGEARRRREVSRGARNIFTQPECHFPAVLAATKQVAPRHVIDTTSLRQGAVPSKRDSSSAVFFPGAIGEIY